MTIVDQPKSISRRPATRRPRPSPSPVSTVSSPARSSAAPLAVTISLATADGTLSGPALRVLDALQALAELQLAAANTPQAATPPRETDSAPAFSLHTASRQVFHEGRALHLTRREYELLAFLCDHPRQVFSRAQLLRLVWGYHSVGGERTVDVHILRVRAKLGADGPTIVTVRGIGYRLDNADRIAVTSGEAPPAAAAPLHSAFDAQAYDAGAYDAGAYDGPGRVEGGRAA